MQSALNTELSKLKECKSDYIIFLEADKRVVLQRSQIERKKQRSTICEWIEGWHDSIIEFMHQYDNCIFIDTNNKTRDEVIACMTVLIQKIKADGIKLEDTY